MSKLLVTGSRSIKNKQVVFDLLDETLKQMSTITELHHSGAVGVDTLAGEWGTNKGLIVQIHRPKTYVPYAYLVRDGRFSRSCCRENMVKVKVRNI
jgi:hypothetical protein